jgi:hypothetical protein
MRRRTLHRATVNARSILLVFATGAAWAIWVVMTLPTVFNCVLAALLLCLTLIAVRIYWLNQTDDDLAKPTGIAWIPVVCVVVTLVGYGMTLVIVQSHYHSEREAAYTRAETRWWHADAASTPRINRISYLLEEPSISDKRKAVASLADLRKSMPPRGKPPSPSELPAWFGHLKSFFTLATQLLTALIVVLAFSRWRRGPSEAVYRAAMPVAALAVAAGLVGTLPSLSRTLTAIVLAPVIAGLAGAIGGLLVATIEVQS